MPDGTDGWLGLHTLCLAGDVAFVDRLRRRPKPGMQGLVGRLLERIDARASGPRADGRGKPGALR